MNNTEIRTNCPQIKLNLYIMIAAVRKRTAAFFYSTQFQITYYKATKNEKTIEELSAAQLQRLRLFLVVKDRYITFYRSRAPPPCLEIHYTHFKIGGLHNDY